MSGAGVIGVPPVLSGWTNENACGMLAVALFLLADSAYRRKRTPVSAWLCLAAQAAGAAMMILAPGFARICLCHDSMAWEIVAVAPLRFIRACMRARNCWPCRLSMEWAGASCADAKPAGGAFAAGGAAERVCDGHSPELSIGRIPA
ncbi:MAG: DUF6056 family protein [Christensenellales bacterium]